MTKLLLIALSIAVSTSAAFAASGAPTQIGAFLSYCKTNGQGCIDKVAEIEFAALVTQPIDHKACLTKGSDDAKALTSKVVQWLTAHPETNSETTDTGIEIALSKLYPCKG